MRTEWESNTETRHHTWSLVFCAYSVGRLSEYSRTTESRQVPAFCRMDPTYTILSQWHLFRQNSGEIRGRKEKHRAQPRCSHLEFLPSEIQLSISGSIISHIFKSQFFYGNNLAEIPHGLWIPEQTIVDFHSVLVSVLRRQEPIYSAISGTTALPIPLRRSTGREIPSALRKTEGWPTLSSNCARVLQTLSRVPVSSARARASLPTLARSHKTSSRPLHMG